MNKCRIPSGAMCSRHNSRENQYGWLYQWRDATISGRHRHYSVYNRMVRCECVSACVCLCIVNCTHVFLLRLNVCRERGWKAWVDQILNSTRKAQKRKMAERMLSMCAASSAAVAYTNKCQNDDDDDNNNNNSRQHIASESGFDRACVWLYECVYGVLMYIWGSNCCYHYLLFISGLGMHSICAFANVQTNEIQK